MLFTYSKSHLMLLKTQFWLPDGVRRHVSLVSRVCKLPMELLRMNINITIMQHF